MEDIGFNGTGSRFNTRFGSNSSIMGKQLNDMSYGIQAGLPQPNVGAGQSISFTPGGALFTPESDPNVFGPYQYNADPPQFKCVVLIDPSGGPDQLKYYLKIARGAITATGTRFPLTQGTQGNGGASILDQNWVIPCQERMIFDVALFPTDSRKPGPQAQSTSAWMANNGQFLLDTEVGHYYVTASFLDYDDGEQNWYPDETFLNSHEPWVSLVANTGESKNNIFTQNTPCGIAQKIALGDGTILDHRGTIGNYPLWLGYGMKVIARIDWKPDQEMWEVRQELLGPIEMNLQFTMTPIAADTNGGNPTANSALYVSAYNVKFINDIANFNYIEKFKDSGFSDSDILATEWWYDPKTI